MNPPSETSASPYRTEIVVAPDRYVYLKLPDSAPLGPAVVSVHFQGTPEAPAAHPAPPAEADPTGAPDPDREDIEWWEEFGAGETD